MRKLKGLKGSDGLKTLGRKNTRLPSIPLYSEPIGEKSEDPLVFEIWQVMGGKESQLKLARQAATLKRETLPDATTPELLVYLWLKERGYPFEFQVEVNGGRRNVGGSVVDFVVRSGKEWALRVHGDFYHASFEQQGLDELRRKLLVGAYAGEFQIDGVVDVYEGDIYRDRETVMTLAVTGYQLPR